MTEAGIEISVPSVVNYDTNPTKLYSLIESKQITEAIEHCKSHPEESSTFVVKKDGTSIRWKLLPLHAALMMRSSDSLIKTLVISFPEGVKEKDDRGMLPLHLAFCFSASESVINVLLDVYAEAMEVKDSKGKVPIDHIEKTNSSNGDDKRAGNKFRHVTSSIIRKAKITNLELEEKLAAAHAAIEKLKLQKSAGTENDINDIVEDLETKLKISNDNYERAVAAFEKRKKLHDNEKNFFVSQVESATEASETTMEMYKKAQETHGMEIQSMKKKHRDLRNENTSSRKKIDELLTNLEALTESSQNEKTDASKLALTHEKELQKQREKMAAMKEIQEDLEKEIMLTKQNMSDVIEKFNGKSNKSYTLEETMDELKSQIDSLEHKLATVVAEKEIIMKELEKQAASNESSSDIIQDQIAKMKKVTEEKETLKDKLQEHEKTNLNMRSKLINSNHRAESLQEELLRRTSDLTMLIENEKGMHEVELDELKTELDTLRQSHEMLTSNSEELVTHFAETKRDLSIEEKKCESYLAIIGGLKSQIAETSHQINTHNSIYETEKEEMNGMISILKEQLKQINEENDSKENKIKKLMVKLEDTKRESKENAETQASRSQLNILRKKHFHSCDLDDNLTENSISRNKYL